MPQAEHNAHKAEKSANAIRSFLKASKCYKTEEKKRAYMPLFIASKFMACNSSHIAR